MKIANIEAVLVREDKKRNKVTGDETIEYLVPLLPVTTEIEMDGEEKQLALEYTLKVLKELGFQLTITEERYKKLEEIAISKSLI